jgi:uncharacterized protein
MPDSKSHPCQSCGACCAYYRVSFYWRELADGQNPLGVPEELTEPYTDFRVCLKGTNLKHRSRCVALEGKVGEQVACNIYSLRPSPCREFAASFENGMRNSRCDEARAKYGLAPLSRHDWPSVLPTAPVALAPAPPLVENSTTA